jgi:hypothetical protein
LTREENLDASVEETASCGIVRADLLSPCSFAATVEPRRKDAGVVEDKQIAGPQPIREIAELPIGPLAGEPLQMQHSGGIPAREGFLGNEFVGEVEVEVRNQHGVRL